MSKETAKFILFLILLAILGIELLLIFDYIAILLIIAIAGLWIITEEEVTK